MNCSVIIWNGNECRFSDYYYIFFSCTNFNLRNAMLIVSNVHLRHMYIDQQLKNNTDRMQVACCYVMDSLKEDNLVVCRLSMLILLDFVV